MLDHSCGERNIEQNVRWVLMERTSVVTYEGGCVVDEAEAEVINVCSRSMRIVLDTEFPAKVMTRAAKSSGARADFAKIGDNHASWSPKPSPSNNINIEIS